MQELHAKERNLVQNLRNNLHEYYLSGTKVAFNATNPIII